MKTLKYIILTMGIIFNAATAAMPPNAKAAIEDAAKNDQFILITFHDAKDASFSALSSAAETLKTTSSKKIAVYQANVNGAENKAIAEKYGIKAADLPVLLVIAPNGVITGGYRQKVTEEQLQRNVGVSDLMLQVMKALQEQKIALVALQNRSTKMNAESWGGVNDFANDPQYKQLVEVIKADPAADGSQDFLNQCRLSKTMNEATVVILLPPGQIGKIITGKTTKADILASLQACAAGSSCGPRGCSDRRFKNDIMPINTALDKILKLQGVTFTWNRTAFPKRNFPEGRNIGLIAQDVERVIPEVIHTDIEGYKSIEYDKLTAVLIESIKEMKQQMNRQDALIAEQQARIKKLEAGK